VCEKALYESNCKADGEFSLIQSNSNPFIVKPRKFCVDYYGARKEGDSAK
jgi:hypothetical protein